MAESATQKVGHDGSLEWLPVSAIKIDPEYQRYMNQKGVDRIVTNYDADVFGVLICSRREDGAIYSLDGQHRREAANELYGEDARVPCFVMTGLDPQREAAIFWKLNKHRLNPTSADTFKARLAAEEPVAMAIKDLMEQMGITIRLYPQPLGPTDVAAFSALESLHNDGTLVPIIAILRGAWSTEPGVLKASNLLGMQSFLRQFYGEFFLDKKNADARMERLVSVLSLISPRDVERRAAMYQESINARRSTAVARAIHHFYNRGLKVNKLKLPNWGIDADEVRMVRDDDAVPEVASA